ncbi:MAG: response regulator receiver sensor signal transduction histidine kinase [Pelosinus sp.]|nr:response regulator receiver sensor signal transduction histidine kinase [Pelosinus sp.]
MNSRTAKKDIILTVDDDRFMRTIIRDALEKNGYEVIEAHNGEEGIKKFLEVYPQMILMDVEMPIMDGFEACKQIKEYPQGKNTPVLFVTSREDEDFVEQAFGCGADDYIIKPIHSSVLRRRIRRIIDGKKAESVLHEKNKELLTMLEKLKQTQSQLIQREKMAGIGQLAAGVAHEINNPLGFVTSNFTMLGDYVKRLIYLITAYKNFIQVVPNEDEQIQKAILEINQLEKEKKLDYVLEDVDSLFSETGDGLKRVGEIVKALRTFSRSDRADQYEEYDLNYGLETTLVVVRNELKYVAEVITDLQIVPMIKTIGSQINQVLLNILVNAAQAIKSARLEERGLITIKTFSDEEFVGCSVTNNGPSIPEEIQSRIFEPFFTTKAVGEGTGLGLSISYDIIVNQHGGKIFFESTSDTGTTFTILLPIKASNHDS